jgi:hypothetical protein
VNQQTISDQGIPSCNNFRNPQLLCHSNERSYSQTDKQGLINRLEESTAVQKWPQEISSSSHIKLLPLNKQPLASQVKPN